MLQAFGRLPKRGETTTIDDLRFRVVRADSRRLYTLQVEPMAAPARRRHDRRRVTRALRHRCPRAAAAERPPGRAALPPAR